MFGTRSDDDSKIPGNDKAMKLYISAATLKTIEKDGRCDLTSVSATKHLESDVELAPASNAADSTTGTRESEGKS